MDYTKKTITIDNQNQKPPATPQATPEPVVGGNKFPDTDKWQGKPVDSNYAPTDLEKDNIQANLKKVTDDLKARFGLDDRGV